MTIKEQLKKAIQRIIQTENFSVEHPAEEKFGDFATNVAMASWKEKGFSNPREMAQNVCDLLKADAELSEIIESVEVAGPGFVNIFLRKSRLEAEVSQILSLKEKYGLGDWGKGQKWVVEHTSPNPNKAMHLGHLRNNLTGMALSNIFEAGGQEIVRDAVDNNRGIAIAKLMWGYLKFGKKDGQETEDLKFWFEHQDEWVTPEDKKMRPDRMVDEFYVKGQGDFEKNKSTEERVRKMVVDWEAEEPMTWAIWKKVLDYSYEGQKLTLARLGSKWDKVWHEHEHYKEGKQWVEKGIKDGIFKTLPDGAILTDLEKFKLTDTIVRKSDGTALYITQDLALTNLKIKTYKADRLFWVIGPEQSLDMKQMFAVCEQLGIGKIKDFTHVAYGYMTLKGQGKMSSRLGNVVFIDQLLDIVKEAVMEKLADREMTETEKQDTAEKLAISAVKYSILKVGRMTDTAFDMENSVSFDGDSGPYLNYVYVRCKGVLDKVKGEVKINSNLEIDEAERSLLRWFYKYPEMVEVAGKELSPNLICSYLLELASRFNSFYTLDKIAGSGEKESYRLALTATVSQTIKNGLGLLGIEVVERM